MFTLSCTPSKTELFEIKINEHAIKVEIASTEAERNRGLMERDNLGKDRGMLFVFHYDVKPAFWMKNTKIPLSIAYIDRNGLIKEIHDLVPFDETPVPAQHYIRYALEVNQGYFTSKGIAAGDSVDLSVLHGF